MEPMNRFFEPAALSSPRGYRTSSNVPQIRKQAAQRLELRWDAVFNKYARDFAGCSDVIDLQTGQVVVNNGHLSRMRNEQDLGTRESRMSETGGPVDDGASDSDDVSDELSPQQSRNMNEGMAQRQRERPPLPHDDSNAMQGTQWTTITPDALAKLGQSIALQIAEALKIHQPSAPAGVIPRNAVPVESPVAQRTASPSFRRRPTSHSHSTPSHSANRFGNGRHPSPLVWGQSLWAAGEDRPEQEDTIFDEQGFVQDDMQGDEQGDSRSSIRRPMSTSQEAQERRYNIFSDEDDALIYRLRTEENMVFRDMERFFPGKDWQCLSNRYNHYLRPGAPRRKLPALERRSGLTNEERNLVLKWRDVDKLTWSEIQRRLPERSKWKLQHGYEQAVAAKGAQICSADASTPPIDETEVVRPVQKRSEIPDSQGSADYSSRMITPPDSSRTEAAHLLESFKRSNLEPSPLQADPQRRSTRTGRRKHPSLALKDLLHWSDDTEQQRSADEASEYAHESAKIPPPIAVDADAEKFVTPPDQAAASLNPIPEERASGKQTLRGPPNATCSRDLLASPEKIDARLNKSRTSPGQSSNKRPGELVAPRKRPSTPNEQETMDPYTIPLQHEPAYEHASDKASSNRKRNRVSTPSRLEERHVDSAVPDESPMAEMARQSLGLLSQASTVHFAAETQENAKPGARTDDESDDELAL